jgi:putative membrane protein
MMGPYRNHPVLLLKYVLICAFMSVIIAISAQMPILLLVGLIPLFFFVRIWFKTRYTFDDAAVRVEKATAFRTDTDILYSKVSSINIVRSVLDRIFGTSTVSFNINSSVNSETPEMSLVLKTDKAEELKRFIESKIYGTFESHEEVEEYREYVTFSDAEVITHSFISMPTGSIIASVFFLIYSIVSFLTSTREGISGMFAFFMFVFSLAVPIARQLLRYFNFRAYRSGDTIYLEHGMFQTYHSSFDVSRVNAVRIRSPMLARLMHRSAIQAEVVGINAMANDATPTLCLMTSNANNRRIMETLLPEFIMDDDMTRQPKEARVPLFFKASVYSAIAAVIVAALCIAMFGSRSSIEGEIGQAAFLTIIIGAIALGSIFILMNMVGCIMALRVIGYHFGEDKFVFVTGVVDRVTTIVQYDRVQTTIEISGPVSRRVGLSKCWVSFLATTRDGSACCSGYMPQSDIGKVREIMMARLRDGRYDYRKNQI